jgi:transcription-repair coupling factor (superfamily II helicase)
LKIQQLLTAYAQTDEVLKIISILDTASQARIKLEGLSGSSDAVIAASVYQANPSSHLFVFNDMEDARYFYTDLENLLEGKSVLLFPPSFKRSFQLNLVDNGLVLERAEVLNRLKQQSSTGELVVTTAEALCEMVLSGKSLEKNTYELRVGTTFDLEFFIDFLTEHHFERSDFVYEAGFFSIRGGIVDVFSFSNEQPYRIELDGDRIESIRTFDPATQLSVKKVDRFFIIPNVQKEMHETARETFFTYLPRNTTVWVKDAGLIRQQIAEGIEKAREAGEKYSGDEELPEVSEVFANADLVVQEITKRSAIEFGTRYHFRTGEKLVFNTSPQPVFKKNFKLLIQNLKENQQAGVTNLIFSDSSRQIERLYTIFEDIDKEVKFDPLYHALTSGFIDRDLKIACYTEHQVFDRFYRGRQRQGYSKNRLITLKELRELKPGDFVTHIDHGIGRFAGLEKVEVNGHIQEAVRLVYRDNDLLYVSINSLHKIAKYVGKDGTVPKVNKLGSDAWEKLKNNTKKKVKDIVRDLIKLYAMRKSQPGFAFSRDTYLQTELEASFMYEDTPDQSKATADLKADMETPHPMDRLVCGDVGFGKTEVAIRAAFKAVSDSRQVAVLVPTTILANQHYRTFKDRLKDFPANVDYINRFRSAGEQKAILQKLKDGKIDILIGTHKLISKEVKFKNLGLLIIDEEQKFGVAAKEKLKAMKANVDTLTLTATPIPRTLHFSLMGARDLSIINTPPPNRQPVNTEVHSYNDDVVRDAIMHEVERNGQVFFVHHRVKDIYEVADRLMALCPGVKVGVAHGQLDGDKLEDVMMKFIEGEYDVLVATTIIESGLDIENANTIIINNAHMFGLSDLHQMRGRVGRNNKKAYCYLLVPSMTSLTQEARRRLQAIEEFSDLGSGFNVAMRDLDIRGAGNLLGGEQSGFIAEIGFEMYNKILDEAIQELKEEEFNELFRETQVHKIESKDCVIETDLEALIPDEYVRNIAERLSLYSELSNLHTAEEIAKYADMLADRFGPPPQQVFDLLDMIRLRETAKQLGFEKIILKNSQFGGYFPDQKKEHYYQSDRFTNILRFVQANPQRCRMKQTTKSLVLSIQHISGINHVRGILEEMLKIA